ncbi:MAG TPA: hypothetical protein V6C86_02715 [Oculatellaceae cyanobacterium]|jgi:hypothetical protein
MSHGHGHFEQHERREHGSGFVQPYNGLQHEYMEHQQQRFRPAHPGAGIDIHVGNPGYGWNNYNQPGGSNYDYRYNNGSQYDYRAYTDPRYRQAPPYDYGYGGGYGGYGNYGSSYYRPQYHNDGGYYGSGRHNTTENAIIGGAVGAGLGAIIDRHNPGQGAVIGGAAGVLGSILGGGGRRHGW